MSKDIQKKLAAIMFTQLVEYNHFIKDNEPLAIKILNEHKLILSKVLKTYNGKIVKHLDAMTFVEFFSATDAVNAAINIHNKLKKINSQNPETFQMNLRIGIHMGEVYEKNNDLFGEGVNLAARVEAIAKPGGTVSTQAIYNSIRSEKNIFVRDMGRVTLKNIKEPERVFKIYNDKNEYDKETQEDLTKKLVKKNISLVDRKVKDKKTEIVTIGISYLKNLGIESDEFFCFGITEDLIIEISKLNNISIPLIDKVIKYKDVEIESDKVIAELNVRYLLSGNIMKMDDNIRISLQLYDGEKSSVLWTNSWECNNESLKNIKGKIIYKLLDTVGIEIPKSLSSSLIKERKISPEAYELYIKGKYLLTTSKSKVDRDIVQDLFRQAIKIDPNYIEPRYVYAHELIRAHEFQRATDILNDALLISKKNKDNSGIAGINTVFGIMYKNWGRYKKSIEFFEKALSLRVSEKNLKDEAKVLNGLAQCYVLIADNDKAFECYNRSLDIKRKIHDKQGIAIGLTNMSINYRRIGDYSMAIKSAKEAIDYYDELKIPMYKYLTKTNLGEYQVIMGYLDEAENNLNESLNFMLEIQDYKSSGMICKYLGLMELNKKDWQSAQNYFIDSLNYLQKAEHRAAFETTTLFLGLSYYYGKEYELAEKFINKAVQITSRRTNISFYGQTAKAVEIMLNTKLGKNTEHEIEIFINEISKDIKKESKENPWIAREYWYISQSYSNLNIKEKANEYRKLSYNHLVEVSKLITNSKMRNDYMQLPLIHRLMSGEIIDLDAQNKNHLEKQKISKDTGLNIFAFCPSCGFNNENKFKFCPQCGGNLS